MDQTPPAIEYSTAVSSTPRDIDRWFVSGQLDLPGAHLDGARLAKDSDARGEWIASIEQLIPLHAHTFDGTLGYRWTTPLGTWELVLDVRMFNTVGVEIRCPQGDWKLSDHRVEYVDAFLRLVGAIG